jgi:hypothetical protein
MDEVQSAGPHDVEPHQEDIAGSVPADDGPDPRARACKNGVDTTNRLDAPFSSRA